MPDKPARGGKRPGAGRPSGSGRYGEQTRVMRIPLSRVDEVRQLLNPVQASVPTPVTLQPPDLGPELEALYPPAQPATRIPLTLYACRVSAGFPSPADDYVEGTLDLNQHLVRHPAATFFVRVAGESMLGAGIHPGDILVVDRALEPTDGKIVIAVVCGELTVKRLRLGPEGEGVRLCPENPAFEPIAVTEELEVTIWGVVTSVIHPL